MLLFVAFQAIYIHKYCCQEVLISSYFLHFPEVLQFHYYTTSLLVPSVFHMTSGRTHTHNHHPPPITYTGCIVTNRIEIFHFFMMYDLIGPVNLMVVDVPVALIFVYLNHYCCCCCYYYCSLLLYHHVVAGFCYRWYHCFFGWYSFYSYLILLLLLLYYHFLL